MLEGRDVVYIESVSGTRSVRLHTEVGRSIPAHTSGAGKALLAWRDPADVATLLDGAPLAASTPHTLTTLAALQEDLAKIRRRGYATDNEEHELGVACVATPVLDSRGPPLAAISVSGPISRILHARRRPGGPAARARRSGRRSAKPPESEFRPPDVAVATTRVPEARARARRRPACDATRAALR